MHVRILDLDGSVAAQPGVRAQATHVLPLRGWGPRLRLACSFADFAAFQIELSHLLGGTHDRRPTLGFVGSGDFHHVSLALLRRQSRPFNLLVFDNHPDWMRRVPLLHCGTWLLHAAGLRTVRRIFHVGGEVDFDNAYRWLAPWTQLRSGKIVVLPAFRHFRGTDWASVPHETFRESPDVAASAERVAQLLDPWRQELSRWPLYVSVDRDVMRAEEAVVNWDSGRLTQAEVKRALTAFLDAAACLAGMDVVGDWSPVEVRGAMRHFLHWSEHPRLTIDPDEATAINGAFNEELLALASGRIKQARAAAA
jgi:hypothetical protein